MRHSPLLATLSLAFILVLPLSARAGEEGADEGEPSLQAQMEKAQKKMEAAVSAMVELSSGVRLKEADVKLILEHAKSFNDIGSDSEDQEDELSKKLDREYEKTGKYSIRAILDDEQYKAWVQKAGVDGKQWLTRWTRAALIQMREQMAAGIEQGRQSIPEQLKQIEAMRETVGDEAYRKMKEGLEASVKMFDAWEKTVKSIPEPDADEKMLIDTYGEKLRAALGDQVQKESSEEDEGDGDEGDEGDEDGGQG